MEHSGTLKDLPPIQGWSHIWLPLCQQTLGGSGDHQRLPWVRTFLENLLVTRYFLILTPSLAELCCFCRSVAFRGPPVGLSTVGTQLRFPSDLRDGLRVTYITPWIWVLIRGLRCSPGNLLDAPRVSSQITPFWFLMAEERLLAWETEKGRETAAQMPIPGLDGSPVRAFALDSIQTSISQAVCTRAGVWEARSTNFSLL